MSGQNGGRGEERGAHHDGATKVSSHEGGIDTLFPAPFTKQRRAAGDDSAESEEVRPRMDGSGAGGITQPRCKMAGTAPRGWDWDYGRDDDGDDVGRGASETVFRGQHKTLLVTTFQEKSGLRSDTIAINCHNVAA